MNAISEMTLTQVVLAIGALGTAAAGLVDASKASNTAGVSKVGFTDIKAVVSKFIPPGGTSALSLPSVLETLFANWINGMPMADQKSVAKAMIKLNLTTATAPGMSAAAGVDPAILTSVATKLSTGDPLTQAETDVYGRFDLLLSAMLDQGYQRGDQRYRNTAKLLAVPIAVILALVGTWAVDGAFIAADMGKAFVAGLVATPLAPIAKDLASSIQAGAKVAQVLKG